MKKSTLFIAGILLANLAAERAAFAQQERKSNPAPVCEANRNAPSPAPYRWQPASSVNILFAPGDFRERELAAFRAAIAHWQSALSQSGTGIKLSDGESRLPRSDEDGYIIVKRDANLRKGHEGQFMSVRGAGGYFTAAMIYIKPGINGTDKLRRLLQHEFGHAFGLMDCPTCPGGHTIMNGFNNSSVLGISLSKLLTKASASLTPCDLEVLARGYEIKPLEGFDVPVGAVIGEDAEVELPVTKKELDTSAPEVGNGRRLIESVGADVPTLTAEESSMVAALLAKETETLKALTNYAFKRDVLIETINGSGKVSGRYHRVSEIILNDEGNRIEKIISFAKPNLKNLIITDEDLKDIGGVQLFGLEIDKAGLYRIIPAGSDTIDGERVLVFQVIPQNLQRAKETGERVFYGAVWVSEKSMKIVKTRGRGLPEGNQRFPTFETRRALFDKQLFPASAFADEVLEFPQRKVRMRVQVRYYDFKRFRSEVKFTEVD
jgi:hypothetical protein